MLPNIKINTFSLRKRKSFLTLTLKQCESRQAQPEVASVFVS